MASLATATIVSTGILPPYNVYLYTFGEPKTGNKDFAKAVNSIFTKANVVRQPTTSKKGESVWNRSQQYWVFYIWGALVIT